MSYISIDDLKKFKYFRELNIEAEGFTIVGMFPYSIAGIYSKDMDNPIVKMPRPLFSELEKLLMKNRCGDNKIVVFCKDTVNFNTDNFAIFLHDFSARVGRWDEVVGYAYGKLELVEECPKQD